MMEMKEKKCFLSVSKVVTLMLILSLFMSSMVYAQMETVYENDQCYVWELFVAEFGEERMLRTNRSIDLAQSIYDSFPQNRMGEIIYPSYWGGHYYDDNGNLVILIVDQTRDSDVVNAEAFVDAFSQDVLITRNVEFSYREMREVSDILWDMAMSDPAHLINQLVKLWFFDVVENRIVIELVDFSEEHVMRFSSEILESPIIVFSESRGDFRFLEPQYCSYAHVSEIPDQYIQDSIVPLVHTELNPGSQITGWNRGASTLSFRVTRVLGGVRQNGFIMAEHAAGDIGSRVLQRS
jgi:hypothetical protein